MTATSIAIIAWQPKLSDDTDQIGFPDGDKVGPAAVPSLLPSGCRAPGRDRRARSPGRALPFSSRTKQIRRCASPARIAASAVGSTPPTSTAFVWQGCWKNERDPRPERIAELDRRSYDIILTDVRMPDLDGPALLRRLRSHWPALTERLTFITRETVGSARERGAAARFRARLR